MKASKSILTLMIYGLLRISCSRNPKNMRNPPYSGYFLMFYGSQSHAFSCKHETHNLLTLVSSYNSLIEAPLQIKLSQRAAGRNGGLTLWVLRICRPVTNSCRKRAWLLQTKTGSQDQFLKDTEPKKHQFFQRIVLIL